MEITNDRSRSIQKAIEHVDSGAFFEQLSKLVSYRTESQIPGNGLMQTKYMDEVIVPVLKEMGFKIKIHENPVNRDCPILFAERIEDPDFITVLSYGHTDVVNGYEGKWKNNTSPWELNYNDERWYGRGVADNKGQHAINLKSLEIVLKQKEFKLGYNIKILIESGEEIDSPGLNEFCKREKDTLRADVFIASDGPRVSADRPTLFLGSRGGILFQLEMKAREEAYHSGNWGGILCNPATRLTHAVTTLVDQHGKIRVPELLPPHIPDNVKKSLADVELGTDEDSPDIDWNWGESSLSPAERVLAWNTIEVLALRCADVDSPVNAISPIAQAVCDFRFVVGTDHENLYDILRKHLDKNGYEDIQIKVSEGLPATRLDPDNQWVQWALKSINLTSGKKPAILPNFGGTTPNYIFSETLSLPTLWIPHSYPACSQHAPDEHFLPSIAKESMAIMAGIWCDLSAASGR